MKRNVAKEKPIVTDKKVNAYAAFSMGTKPFLTEDLFKEPTKEEQKFTFLDYIPFSTFDLWRLDRLQAIVNNSPTTSAIISQKVNYSVGDGFYTVPSSNMDMLPSVRKARSERQAITPEQEETLNDFLMSVNPEGENIEELTAKILTDFYSFGNAFIELTKVSKGSTKIVSARLLPISWCRPKKAAANELYPTHIGVSSQFEEAETSNPSEVVNLPIFPKFERIDDAEKSIVHLKMYEPTLVYWGVPDWVAAKIWAELEYRIPKFNQSKFENGFTPSAIVSLFGCTNQEEAQSIVNAMKGCFTGTGNNSKMFIQALRDETYKADVQILNSQSEGEFLDLQNMAQTAIISAHKWTAALTGLRTAGSLGTNQQIRSEFDIIYSTVIRPVQRLFLTKFLNPFIKNAGEYLGYNWSNIALDIAKPTPVSFLGDITIGDVLSIDEQRQELGFEPLNIQPTNNIGDGNTN